MDFFTTDSMGSTNPWNQPIDITKPQQKKPIGALINTVYGNGSATDPSALGGAASATGSLMSNFTSPATTNSMLGYSGGNAQPSTLGGQSSLGGAGYKAYMYPGTSTQQAPAAPTEEGSDWRNRIYNAAPSAKKAGLPVANAATDQAAREADFKSRGLDAEGKNKLGLYAGGKTFGENLEGMDASQAMSLMQAGGTLAGLVGNLFAR